MLSESIRREKRAKTISTVRDESKGGDERKREELKRLGTEMGKPQKRWELKIKENSGRVYYGEKRVTMIQKRALKRKN